MFKPIIFLCLLIIHNPDFTYGAFQLSRGRSEYDIHSNQKSWAEAKLICERKTFGGLVSLDTGAEDGFLKVMVAGLGMDFAWTSGVYDASGNWKWASTRTIMSYTNWGQGQPISTSPDYRVALWANPTSSNWQVRPKVTASGFICETPLDKPVPCYRPNDLLIVLDGSGSIGQPNFVTALNFVASLASAFGRPSRIGFVTYSDGVRSVISLTNNLTPTQIQTTIKSAQYEGSSTRTDLGIDMAISHFHSTRPGVPKKMVVLTDGQSNTQSLTIASANRAKASGIQGFSVGIGGFDITNPELVAISGGVNGHVFTASTFDSLIELIRPLSIKVCG